MRELLVVCLRQLPGEEQVRRSYLESIWDVDDEAKAEKLTEDFKAIKDTTVRRKLLQNLNQL